METEGKRIESEDVVEIVAKIVAAGVFLWLFWLALEAWGGWVAVAIFAALALVWMVRLFCGFMVYLSDLFAGRL